MFLRRSLASLARAYKLHANKCSSDTFWGLAPPPPLPPYQKKLARYWFGICPVNRQTCHISLCRHNIWNTHTIMKDFIGLECRNAKINYLVALVARILAVGPVLPGAFMVPRHENCMQGKLHWHWLYCNEVAGRNLVKMYTVSVHLRWRSGKWGLFNKNYVAPFSPFDPWFESTRLTLKSSRTDQYR